LVELAGARGLPVSIYRPGYISSSTVAGVSNDADLASLLINAVVRTKSIPRLKIPIDIVPVDSVARAIVYISRQPETASRHFHLNNPQPCTWEGFMSLLRATGFELTELDTDIWKSELMTSGHGDPVLLALLSAQEQKGSTHPRPLISCRNTLDVLAKSSIHFPSVEWLLQISLDHLLRSNVLPAPGNWRASTAAR